jgi:RHS repeat-associated protein
MRTTLTCVWNTDNRLTDVIPTGPQEGDKKFQFTYDYMGRRARKQAWTRTSGNWVADLDHCYLYDGWSLDTTHLAWRDGSPGGGGLSPVASSQGWNVIAVLDDSGDAMQRYTWGLDLSETLQGAGGVGGLLGIKQVSGSNAGDYIAFFDGNGNVGQLIDVSDGSTAARYEYDPYGNELVSAEPFANENNIRFSTKWFDGETDTYYYGYRYYSASLGRWLSRDPVGRLGGVNSYAFVTNHPTLTVDVSGLMSKEECECSIGDLTSEDGNSLISELLDAIQKTGACRKPKFRCSECSSLPPGTGAETLVMKLENDKGYYVSVSVCYGAHNSETELRETIQHELWHAFRGCAGSDPGSSCDACLEEELEAHYMGSSLEVLECVFEVDPDMRCGCYALLAIQSCTGSANAPCGVGGTRESIFELLHQADQFCGNLPPL